MSDVGNRRLLKLADHLDTVEHRKLKMDVWMAVTRESQVVNVNIRNDVVVGVDKVIDDCKTVACAMGHACGIKSFRRAGLKLEAELWESDGRLIADLMPTYKNRSGYWAASAFFEVNVTEAEWLFAPISYTARVRPTTVARRLRKFVADRD